MLRHYAVNLPGPSHLESGTPCQDSYAVETLEGAIIAAVADGLGSESLSDVGAQTAARAAVNHCKLHLGECEGPDDEVALARAAFYAAYEAVLDEAARRGESAGQMDCTLCLAVFDGTGVLFGQSGDSGLVVAHADGTYEAITRMQRDDEGRVFPLCFDDSWEFGRAADVSSALLCTDGVLESIVAPPVLAKLGGNPVDTRLSHGFLHPRCRGEAELDALRAEAEAYLDAFPADMLDDDKTVVVLFDDERPPAEQPKPYYDGPDWSAVCAQANALIYAASPQAAEAPTGEAEAAEAETGPVAPAAPAVETGPPPVPSAPVERPNPRRFVERLRARTRPRRRKRA